MKKMLVSGAVILATICSANAKLPDAAARQGACDLTKNVWITHTKACVPFKSCSDEVYRAYCVKEFKDIEISDPEVADELARMVIKDLQQQNKLPEGSAEQNPSGTSVNNALGQDYIAYNIGGDKYYLQFEFDDTHDYTNNDNIKNTIQAVAHYLYQANVTEFGPLPNDGGYGATLDMDAGANCKNIIRNLKVVDPVHFGGEVVDIEADKCAFQVKYR